MNASDKILDLISDETVYLIALISSHMHYREDLPARIETVVSQPIAGINDPGERTRFTRILAEKCRSRRQEPGLPPALSYSLDRAIDCLDQIRYYDG